MFSQLEVHPETRYAMPFSTSDVMLAAAHSLQPVEVRRRSTGPGSRFVLDLWNLRGNGVSQQVHDRGRTAELTLKIQHVKPIT